MDLASGAHIPQEILNSITELLQHDMSGILKLCLVSRGFCYEARRLLYRQIRVTTPAYKLDPHAPLSLSIDTFTKFLTTITTRNTHLGPYVRELYYSPESGSRPTEHWELMNRGLFFMVNLKVFSFRNFVPPSKRTLFRGTKFQLEEFYWEDGYSVDLGGETAQFLRTQPELRVLAATLTNHDFLSPLFPRLQTYIGDTDSIKQLIRHQPMDKLRWRGYLSHGPSSHLNFLPSLTSLRFLSVGGRGHGSRTWLSVLCPFLNSLELLHITGLHDSLEETDEFVHIPKLKRLRVFIWSPLTRYVKSYTEPDQGRLVSVWFKELKKLEVVYFYTANGQEQNKQNTFLCWNRGNPFPVPQSRKEVAERESIQEFAPLLDPSFSSMFSMY